MTPEDKGLLLQQMIFMSDDQLQAFAAENGEISRAYMHEVFRAGLLNTPAPGEEAKARHDTAVFINTAANEILLLRREGDHQPDVNLFELFGAVEPNHPPGPEAHAA